MNCLWIILLLSCFGGNLGSGCGNNSCCGNNGGRSGSCDNDNCGCDRGRQRNRCRRAVENAIDECGSERAVMRTLQGRDRECRPEKPECPEARGERMERHMERTADNNSRDASNMNPPRWQDFPEVSRSSSNDDCGCNS